MTLKSVLFACDLDSQIFGALPLALGFQARGWRTVLAVEAPSALPKSVLERLDGRFDILDRPIGALAVDEAAHGFDAIGVYATGSRLARFRHDFEIATRVLQNPRPALFCGFNGVVFEKFEEGLSWRLGYDLICLNGPRDHDAFMDFVGFTPFADQPAVVVGLRRRTDAPVEPHRAGPNGTGRRTLVFAEQVAVPTDPLDRRSLVAALARLARSSPAWDVVLKARVRPNEQTFFEPISHVAADLAREGAAPPNLKISYGPLNAHLETADLFGTVSSTALFDAIDHGVPSFVVADFGIRNAYGAHVFFGSGLMTKLSAAATVDDLPVRAPDPLWLDRIGYAPAHSVAALIDRLEAFDPTRPPPAMFQTFERPANAPAAPEPIGPDAIRAGRAVIERALAAGDRAAARAALARLGETIALSDAKRSLEAAWRRREGPVAAFARRIGMYWLYKKMRRRLQGPTPR